MITKRKAYRKQKTSRERARQRKAKLAGKESKEYVWDDKQELLIVHAVNDLGARTRVNYPVARLFGDGTKRLINWTKSTLQKALEGALVELAEKHGGKWHLEVDEAPIAESLD